MWLQYSKNPLELLSQADILRPRLPVRSPAERDGGGFFFLNGPIVLRQVQDD